MQKQVVEVSLDHPQGKNGSIDTDYFSLSNF
jgi:hypothetical protein